MERGQQGHWIVAGGLNLDVLAKPTGAFRLKESNPGSMRERPGGVGFNIARNLALLDLRVLFLTVRGDDLAGVSLLSAAERKGIDLSCALVRRGHATSRYLAIHDHEGEMVAAISDMSLFDTMTPADIAPWLSLGMTGPAGCEGAVLEPNLPAPVIRLLVSEWDVPLFADAVSIAKASRLREVLPRLTGLKVNRAEAEELAGRPVRSVEEAVTAARALMEHGVGAICLSLGTDGAVFADRTGCVAARPPPAGIHHPGNTTGAGDAMASIFAWAVTRGRSLEQTARLGMAASAITMESGEAVNPVLSAGLLDERSACIETEGIKWKV